MHQFLIVLLQFAHFYLLKKFNLENKFCFFYSICVAILFYPTAGTPFSDHHTLIFCLLSLYCFILAIIKKNNIYWFLTPIILGFSFLSKQAPTIYVIFVITILSIIFFIKSKSIFSFISAFIGAMVFLILFFILIYLGNINFNDFIIQYFSYPQSLGGSRFEWLSPFEFQRIIWRYKLQYLSIVILFYLVIKFSFSRNKKRFFRLFNFIKYNFFLLTNYNAPIDDDKCNFHLLFNTNFLWSLSHIF